MGVLSLLFDFRGRVDRSRYWAGLALAYLGATAFLVACATLFWHWAQGKEADLGVAMFAFLGAMALFALVWLTATIATFALVAKRLRDLGVSPYWCLALFLAPSPVAVFSMVASVTRDTPSYITPGLSGLYLGALVIIGMIAIGCMPSRDSGPSGAGAHANT